MPYQQEISIRRKSLFLFLLDHSASMIEPIGGSSVRKMDAAADQVNAWLMNLTIRCASPDRIKDFFEVGVIGYHVNAAGDPVVESALGGPLADKSLVSISQIQEGPVRLKEVKQQVPDDETGDIIEMPVTTPIWVEPRAQGGIAMCSALRNARKMVSEWIKEHATSFPPIVINITGGESEEDADAIDQAQSLKALGTADGNVLLFNCYLSKGQSEATLFPHDEKSLPDERAKMLFHMSSFLPDLMYENLLSEGFELEPGARGMAVNTGIVTIIRAFDVGTRPARTLR